jgi:hypothetical protein
VAGPLDRFLAIAGGPARGEQLAFSGSGSARQPLGPVSFWLALRYRARLVPARSFAFVEHARLAGLPLRRVSEEYRDGRGRYRAGRRELTGDAVDRAQHAALWGWTLVLAPRAAFALAEVVAEPVSATAVRVLFPFRAETWQATLRFDAGSGLLVRLETHRHEPTGRRSSPWSLEVAAVGALDGRPFPAEVLTRWHDQPALRLRLEAARIAAAR